MVHLKVHQNIHRVHHYKRVYNGASQGSLCEIKSRKRNSIGHADPLRRGSIEKDIIPWFELLLDSGEATGGSGRRKRSWVQAWEAHQHTFQSFKNVFLSRNLD